MPLTVAAIWYSIDQNSPSTPFLLELDCSARPTAEELEKALVAYGERSIAEEVERDRQYALENPEGTGEPCQYRIRVKQEDDYGDLCLEFEHNENQLLFVGLPAAIEHLKEKFDSRDWPPDDWEASEDESDEN